MSPPRFYVVARVVGAPGSFKRWDEILVHLCAVSKTEPKGTAYYWGRDLDGEPDTLWGLEGYTDADGFFNGHPASDVFKTQMAFVDNEKLLAQDYDLHHYLEVGGWITREDDPNKDSKTSHVAVLHFFAKDGERDQIIEKLKELAEVVKEVKPIISSFGILKEVEDKQFNIVDKNNLVSLWLRTDTPELFKAFEGSEPYKVIESLKKACTKTELHQSKTFNGHIDVKPLIEQ